MKILISIIIVIVSSVASANGYNNPDRAFVRNAQQQYYQQYGYPGQRSSGNAELTVDLMFMAAHDIKVANAERQAERDAEQLARLRQLEAEIKYYISHGVRVEGFTRF